jgi:hypothetical protein
MTTPSRPATIAAWSAAIAALPALALAGIDPVGHFWVVPLAYISAGTLVETMMHPIPAVQEPAPPVVRRRYITPAPTPAPKRQIVEEDDYEEPYWLQPYGGMSSITHDLSGVLRDDY